MAAPLYTTASGQLYHAGKILIATVGLPARGKTHLSHAIERYLTWLGVKSGVFSLGDHRRKVLGGADKIPSDYFVTGPKSEETEALRKRILDEFDDTVIDFFFNQGGQVVVYDANNSIQARRYAIREKYGKLGVHVMFLESICTDPKVVEANVRSVKLSSPDYVDWDPEKAMQNYYSRIAGHEKTYEPIENPSFPYIKLINVGEQVVVNNIQGYLQSRIVFFLMNIHNRQRTIYLVRAGEALVEHLYKADADLSSLGWDYADEMAHFMVNLRRKKAGLPPIGTPTAEKAGAEGATGSAKDKFMEADSKAFEVWTSQRRRSSHTAYPLAEAGYKVIERSQLSEMNPGVVDGMSVEDVKFRFPDEYERKLRESYSHRFPRAESYHDLSVRLEPIIFELERTRNDVLIIGQSSVLRCLIAYLQGLQPGEIPSIQVREGQLIEILPQAYGVKTEVHEFWDPVARRNERDAAFDDLEEEFEQGASARGKPNLVHINDVVMATNAPSTTTAGATTVFEEGDKKKQAIKAEQPPGKLQWARRRNSSGKSPEGIRADREAIRELEAQLRDKQIKEQREKA
ncbi:related to 6-phosphofructo-2-kinase [Melanopsichium pennsylvanicum]|uniref:Related to 6-phosphofructo-2-kinase n=2 Tax=Melanopsichium pennsylvanicum TaxID=63383 RepID=A0AAJ5C3A1_9BASI|nr:related to 6-phosphofructo-2-kinase [Melanopsichium pennsylvanicum 4]SNX82396.1 related to 6-phosphofructo-2-kinase [Melanopsichium pennsylvanicum]